MVASRREVLLQGCAIGAGIFASRLPGLEALAQGQPPQRRALGSMLPNDPILEAWREGVQLLKDKRSDEKISWASFAAIHGNATAFNLCPHGNWYFLPWHRAYLLMYERAVRQLTGANDFALPYWDWTNDRQLPEAFAQTTWNGRPNPLFEPQRDVSPTDSLADEIVGDGIINDIMSTTLFETFGTSRPIRFRDGQAQDSLDQEWITCEFCGTQGTLERTPHNTVHLWVGGVMASAQSALDPIFMMHHCNIDRLWAVWNASGPNQNSIDALWSDMTFQNNFYNPDGSSYSPKVSDLYIPETLGYTYGLPSGRAVAEASPAVVRLDDKLRTIYSMRNIRDVAGIKTYVAQNSTGRAAAPHQHLDLSVEVDKNLVAAVARSKPLSSGSDLINPTTAREAAASGARALAFIREIKVDAHLNTLYRVFINCQYLNEETPTSDPHYVGAFSIFGSPREHVHNAGPGASPSVAFDLTNAIQRLYGSASEPPALIRLQILPVPIKKRIGPVGTANPDRLELVFIAA
jgi:tyrosinase